GSVANGQARYKGAGGEVVRNSRGQDRRSSIRVRDQAGSDRKQTGCRYRGSWENIHQGPDCKSGHSLYAPPVISLRCFC
ncbi:unnamed protein product, partial [Staurois parvus]